MSILAVYRRGIHVLWSCTCWLWGFRSPISVRLSSRLSNLRCYRTFNGFFPPLQAFSSTIASSTSNSLTSAANTVFPYCNICARPSKSSSTSMDEISLSSAKPAANSAHFHFPFSGLFLSLSFCYVTCSGVLKPQAEIHMNHNRALVELWCEKYCWAERRAG